MTTKKPDAFIFDWDNTLLDTWAITAEIMNHVLIAFKKDPWTLEKIKNNTHRSAKDFFPEIFGDETEKAFVLLRDYISEKKEDFMKRLKPINGAKELLDLNHQLDIPCVILSNKQGELLRLEVKHMGWEKYFKGIYGSLDFPFDKPHPSTVMEIRKHHDLIHKNIWFLGDTDVDWQCAKDSNCKAIKIGQNLSLDHYAFPTCMEFLDYFSEFIKK
jgi:phosphoglycolate phosphatase